ncbi:TetR/AcrR family transcriptional regulator C-terminal domain-containing protein [Amycolatopsis sp. H20-H5]|uniref:TetR/AcrR family transcriptional regulator C-terminal domain-containing protein n=1 Tax=Amycolatopsis sp. H20-H5 TaxID=3046309 RepID=UPI002DB678C7|nr:TetR/AcrR family transcriptional regulator C-terminal domain-containing protein [Amycolatopsis sp. H20-H5]MEC3977074.1 TetR/AcrR family transcriptional regulator C-terminal domain-containing protein [Amycolatopsis sp. H20-H5]
MEAPYLRIVAEIRRRITSGELPPGARVPSTRQITRDWGVAMATATKVLTTLRHEGLVTAKPGSGTVVTKVGPHRRETELSRERVVRAAVRIADAEGIAALSMRRVASGLGVATMALYRHVEAKDELVLAMADVVLGEVEFPARPPVTWRAQLELMARLQWALFRQHPWLAQVLSVTRPQPLPNLLLHAEWALRALDGLGLASSTMLYAHITVFNHVRATALNFEWEAEAQVGTARSDEEWLAVHEPALRAVVESGRYPHFVGVTAAGEFDFTLDTLFEFGLQRLLDGFAVLVAKHRS